jgi:hypothetical protein
MNTQSPNYTFNYEIAVEYGSDEAIMLNNFLFWIEKNRQREINFYDARTWTYNTIDAFTALFAFWTKKQVRRILDSLVKQGILIKGNYNKIAYDRTNWYAFKDENQWFDLPANTPQPRENSDMPKKANADAQMGESKSPFGQIDLPKRADLYQITKTDEKHILKNNNTPTKNQPICEEVIVLCEEKVAIAEQHPADSFKPVPDMTVLEKMNAEDKQAALIALKKVPDATIQAALLFRLNKAITSGVIQQTALVYLCSLIGKAKNGSLDVRSELIAMKKAQEAAQPKPSTPPKPARDDKAEHLALLRRLVAKHPEAIAELQEKKGSKFWHTPGYSLFIEQDFIDAGLI